jgi:hypothetical protein
LPSHLLLILHIFIIKFGSLLQLLQNIFTDPQHWLGLPPTILGCCNIHGLMVWNTMANICMLAMASTIRGERRK